MAEPANRIIQARLNSKVSLADVDDYWAEVEFRRDEKLGYTYLARPKDKLYPVYPKKRAYFRSIKFYETLELAKRAFIKRLKPIEEISSLGI